MLVKSYANIFYQNFCNGLSEVTRMTSYLRAFSYKGTQEPSVTLLRLINVGATKPGA